MLHLTPAKICRLSLPVVFAVILLFSFFSWHRYASPGACTTTLGFPLCDHSQPTRKNIVVATRFDYHHDVIFALVWTLQRVMKGNGKLSVYAPFPLSWNFETVVNEFGLYNGPINDSAGFIRELNSNHEIDMLISGTCEIECAASTLLFPMYLIQ